MKQQDKRLENLHQQASTLYLQGEYTAALETWRQLLKIDPKDERAREGVRLCELLVQEEGGTLPPESAAPPPPPSPAAQAGQEPGVGFGIGEDLDEELDELDELLGEGGATDWMDKAPQQEAPAAEPAPVQAGPTDQAFPDMSDDDFNLDGADRPANPDTASEIDAAFNFESPAAPSAPQTEAPVVEEPAGAAQPTDASAEELQRRADELMAEALEHYENGQRAEALTVLERLAILDENNAAANTFASHIRAEMEALPGAAAPEALVQPEAGSPEVDLEMTFESSAAAEDLLADPVAEPAPPAPSAPPAPPAQPAAQIDNGMIDFGVPGGDSLGLGGPEGAEPVVEEIEGIAAVAPGGEFDLEDAVISDETADATPAAGAEPAAPAKAKLLMNKWLMIAAIVLLAAGGGYVALQFFGGSGPVETENAALAAPPPLGDLGDIDGGPADPSPTAAANANTPPPAAAVVPAGVLDEVLDRGDAAYEEGNYAAAVLAYNEALKLDPQNEVARRRLEEAGELYRDQKDELEQRALAIQAFNDGDYRNALRLLYRLQPADEAEAQRFERFKFNGWYNMGLRALKGGDCRLARSNLREAQQVDPTDAGMQYAMELSGRCFEGKTDGYFDATRALHLRALDD